MSSETAVDSDLAVVVRGVGKKYKIYDTPFRRIRAAGRSTHEQRRGFPGRTSEPSPGSRRLEAPAASRP